MVFFLFKFLQANFRSETDDTRPGYATAQLHLVYKLSRRTSLNGVDLSCTVYTVENR